jgi:hypothetical protein
MPSTICGRGHLVGVAAEDLHGDGALLFGELGVFERAVDPAHESLGAHHLGDDEAAAAVAFHEAAERRVGHAGHGRDREWRLEVDRSYFHGRFYSLATKTR